MNRRRRAIFLFWVGLGVLMCVQSLLVPDWLAEADDFAWWTYVAPPKPAGAWLDQRQAFVLAQSMVLLVPLVLAATLPVRIVTPRTARRLLQFSLAVSIAYAVFGLAAVLARQPLYIGGRLLYCGLFACVLTGAFLKFPPKPLPRHRVAET